MRSTKEWPLALFLGLLIIAIALASWAVLRPAASVTGDFGEMGMPLLLIGGSLPFAFAGYVGVFVLLLARRPLKASVLAWVAWASATLVGCGLVWTGGRFALALSAGTYGDSAPSLFWLAAVVMLLAGAAGVGAAILCLIPKSSGMTRNVAREAGR